MDRKITERGLMMQKVRNKLKNNSGETLVELLCAILIGTLSAGILFSGIMLSARMNKRAEETDSSYYADLSAAEAKDTPIGDITISVKEDIPGSMEKKISAHVYGGNDLYSYQKVEIVPPEGGEAP